VTEKFNKINTAVGSHKPKTADVNVVGTPLKVSVTLKLLVF
jgi:hypothetical protein